MSAEPPDIASLTTRDGALPYSVCRRPSLSPVVGRLALSCNPGRGECRALRRVAPCLKEPSQREPSTTARKAVPQTWPSGPTPGRAGALWSGVDGSVLRSAARPGASLLRLLGHNIGHEPSGRALVRTTSARSGAGRYHAQWRARYRRWQRLGSVAGRSREARLSASPRFEAQRRSWPATFRVPTSTLSRPAAGGTKRAGLRLPMSLTARTRA